MLLNSYLDTVDDINFKIFLESTSKAMVDREKKRGRQKYKNLNISKTKSYHLVKYHLRYGTPFQLWVKVLEKRNTKIKL